MMAIVIELAGTIDPTERSRCPAIINNPTGSAMMPSSEATLSQLAEPPADMKFAPPKIEKKTQHGDHADQRADLGAPHEAADRGH